MNRSQADLDLGISREDMLDKESAFFAPRNDLQSLPGSCKGLRALVQKLVHLQKESIRTFLPDFKDQVCKCQKC